MDQQSVIRQAIEATYRQLEAAGKPQERSRIATSTNGYIHLTSWSNAQLLRTLIRIFTSSLPKSEYRLKTQLDDAARSVIANIEEGYRRPTTMEYITFLGYSQASLTEVKGDIQRCLQDGFLKSVAGSSLFSLKISLADWHETVKKTVVSRPAKLTGFYRNLKESSNQLSYTKNYTNLTKSPHIPSFQKSINSPTPIQAFSSLQNPLKSFKFLYPPVDDLQANKLTYEIFIELINKTDWNLRKLVSSLEDKLARDQKFYQVERARIRGNTRWNR